MNACDLCDWFGTYIAGLELVGAEKIRAYNEYHWHRSFVHGDGIPAFERRVVGRINEAIQIKGG